MRPQNMMVVLPGDDVTEYVKLPPPTTSLTSPPSHQPPPQPPPQPQQFKLGNGVARRSSAPSSCNSKNSSGGVSPEFMATVAGRLETKRGGGNVYFVRQNLQRYYRPSLEDRVVCTVMDRMGVDGSTGGEIYRVNIGGIHPATLSSLAFEGATKRNRPVLQPGQLLYARVAALHPHLDPVLSCQLGPNDGGIPRKDWMTNEGCYGELRGGTVCRVTTGLARELLHPNNVVLGELARTLAFEVAIGVNGYLWIHSPRPEYTILIQNAIQNSSVMTDGQVRAMVKTLVYAVEKQIQREKDSMEEG